MKKILLCGILAAGCCLYSGAQSKINNVGRLRIDQFHQLQAEFSNQAPARAAALGQQTVTVFVTLNDGSTYADLEAWGAEVVDHSADIAIASLPMNLVEELAAQDFVKFIDFGYEAAPYMDQARSRSFAEEVHTGTAAGIDKAYKGEGVYVGLYDMGLDPNHINFTDHQGNTRVKAVYLGRGGKVSPYEGADVARFDTDARSESHGTHVLGTIAGRTDVSGKFARSEGTGLKVEEGNIPYYGVAPEADILVGCGDFDNASINAGIGAVIKRAKQDNKPVVVNLSLGHNRGSHDPNETVNKYLDSQANDAIIVVAAGNEGGTAMSFEFKTEKKNGGEYITTIIPVGDGSAAATAKIMYTAEVWSDTKTPFEATVFLFDKVSGKNIVEKEVTGNSGSFSLSTNNNSTFGQYFTSSSISARWGVDGSTNRFNLQLDNTTQAKNSDVVVGIAVYTIKGQRVNGYCDAYNGYSQAEVKFAEQSKLSGSQTGTDIGSINGMACGLNTISVGAWVTRTQVPTIGGRNTSISGAGPVGEIASFSSHGQSGDGRMLPIVCAPGAQIISSVSSYWVDAINLNESNWSAKAQANGKTYPWYYMQGTSMATPFVTGTIALWLEAFPAMRAAEVKQILAKTCTKDAFTSDPSNVDKWGNGKINVLEGLKEAIRMNASVKSTLADAADQNLIVVSNGAKQYEVSCAGVDGLSCKLFNLQGMEVAAAGADGDTVSLDASALSDGIYVLSVDAAGQKLSRKLVVK